MNHTIALEDFLALDLIVKCDIFRKLPFYIGVTLYTNMSFGEQIDKQIW